MFDPSKPVQTRGGRKARIICTDRKNGIPILALIGTNENIIHGFYSNGQHCGANKNKPEDDLVNIDDFAKPGRDIVKTRAGDRVWLLTRNGLDEEFPITGFIENDTLKGKAYSWTKDGRLYSDHYLSQTDLILT